MADRLSIFIDGSNFYHALKEVHGRTDIDFKDFAKSLSRSPRGVNRSLNPVSHYNSVVDASKHPRTFASQQRLFGYLAKADDPPFFIYRGRIEHHGRLKYRCRNCEEIVIVSSQKCPICGFVETLRDSSEKGVDVKLAVDLVAGALENQYDIALLVSEDSDFVPALEVVKKYNKRTELAVLSSTTRKRGYHLINTVDWTHYLKPKELVWYKGDR